MILMMMPVATQESVQRIAHSCVRRLDRVLAKIQIRQADVRAMIEVARTDPAILEALPESTVVVRETVPAHRPASG
jgi:hypothetical protein